MKTRSLIAASAAIVALLAGTPALADGHMEAAAETALPSGPEGPALWKVADEDTTIFLFGTVHALPAELVWYDAEIAEALNSADTVVTEIPMDPASEAAMQQLAVREGMFADGTTLRSLLTEEQAAAYEGALGGLGVPPAAFDGFEPWMAGLTLGVLPLLQQGYDMQSGVDKVILSKAADTPKDALETAEFQLALFDSLPREQQVEFLMAAVEGVGEVKQTLDAMVAEWVKGDADALAAIMNEDMDDEALATALLYDRNANWAEWIEARLASNPGTVFIAVGAGHLAGNRSVQDYLAERGIETARVQ
ncbi:TraB/GumN family protein [Qipengyuania sp. ASV99]|uniref:TraB/GumN family protein n=1 Tax=Qipengyuania sp. ASV99 TaxID=3399681 RepID=UPI003A4C67DB